MPAKHHKKHFQAPKKPAASGSTTGMPVSGSAPTSPMPVASVQAAAEPGRKFEETPGTVKKTHFVSTASAGHSYVMGELVRISILTVIIIAILVVLRIIFK